MVIDSGVFLALAEDLFLEHAQARLSQPLGLTAIDDVLFMLLLRLILLLSMMTAAVRLVLVVEGEFKRLAHAMKTILSILVPLQLSYLRTVFFDQ